MAERLPAGLGLAPGGDPAKVPVFLLMVSGQIESAEVCAHLCLLIIPCSIPDFCTLKTILTKKNRCSDFWFRRVFRVSFQELR